jgi:hypothetical protein
VRELDGALEVVGPRDLVQRDPRRTGLTIPSLGPTRCFVDGYIQGVVLLPRVREGGPRRRWIAQLSRCASNEDERQSAERVGAAPAGRGRLVPVVRRRGEAAGRPRGIHASRAPATRGCVRAYETRREPRSPPFGASGLRGRPQRSQGAVQRRGARSR